MLEGFTRRNFNVNFGAKQDVFVLGMTILYAAGLVDPVACYEGNKLNPLILNNLMNALQQRYTNVFIETLAKMLSLNPTQRISWLELKNLLANVSGGGSPAPTPYPQPQPQPQPQLQPQQFLPPQEQFAPVQPQYQPQQRFVEAPQEVQPRSPAPMYSPFNERQQPLYYNQQQPQPVYQAETPTRYRPAPEIVEQPTVMPSQYSNLNQSSFIQYKPASFIPPQPQPQSQPQLQSQVYREAVQPQPQSQVYREVIQPQPQIQQPVYREASQVMNSPQYRTANYSPIRTQVVEPQTNVYTQIMNNAEPANLPQLNSYAPYQPYSSGSLFNPNIPIAQQTSSYTSFSSGGVLNPNIPVAQQTSTITSMGGLQQPMPPTISYSNISQPNYQVRSYEDHIKRGGAGGAGVTGGAAGAGGSDLDRRIQEALKASEETLRRNQEYLQRE